MLREEEPTNWDDKKKKQKMDIQFMCSYKGF